VSAKDRLNALEKRTGGPDMPRKVLVARSDGTFIARGVNGDAGVYTAQEAADLEARGLATLITFRVVYGPEKADSYGDE